MGAGVRKVNACPMAVRLAWHSSGTFEKEGMTGGSNGAGMRFEPESTDGANAGLGIIRDLLKPVSDHNPEVSKADIWVAAGANAVEFLGGPKVPHAFCRTDHADGSKCPPNGRLPDGSQGAQHLRDVFYRMGFNDKEIVALSGAHTLGRMHLSRSGFDGPWTTKPLSFDNEYFKNLLDRTWVKKEYAGNDMFEDAETRTLGMLPTDIALTTDPAFLPWVQKYAADEQLFFTDFSAAFSKLLANNTGCPYEEIGRVAATTDTQRASKEFREYSMHGSEREVRRLAPLADPTEVEATSGRTALHKAAFWGHSHLVPFLAECGVPVNAQDFNGDTALHDASRFGHTKVVEQLLVRPRHHHLPAHLPMPSRATGRRRRQDARQQGRPHRRRARERVSPPPRRRRPHRLAQVHSNPFAA